MSSKKIKAVDFPDPFKRGDYGEGMGAKTLLELRLMNMSASIRNKPGWEQKRKNTEIVAKWSEEAKAQNFTEEMIQYVLNELEHYEGLKEGKIEVSAVDGTWQADDLIPHELLEQLKNDVKQLEDVPESKKDWHPGSKNQVLDILHPSLFCLVYGQTRTMETDIPLNSCLRQIGGGNPIFAPTSSKDYSMSTKYQWLPSDFSISEEGSVSVKSYINNLHPEKNKSLCKTLPMILEHFVPLFNRVLTDTLHPRPPRYLVNPYSWYEETEEYEPVEDRTLTLPPLGSFGPPPAPAYKYTLEGREVQVIVKLANIELTPENPSYAGGVWHVEGMRNESIVASGIYYYASENITECKLSFRQAVREPDYEQNDDRGMREVYGLVDNGPLNQVLGSVVTKEGRCLCFPNIYQHRVSPFKLIDSGKAGYRKILVFFLVDPTKRVVSTASVAPQQSHWLVDELRLFAPFNGIPRELVERIVELSEWPMSLDTAKMHRENLMKERKYFIDTNNNELFEREFSLCEH